MIVIILGFLSSIAGLVLMLLIGFSIDALARKYAPDFESERLLALTRDDYTCQVCGYSPVYIAHHVTPRRIGGSDSANNLMTVCSSCHPKIERVSQPWARS